jgi:Flp pilus assembly protein TadD
VTDDRPLQEYGVRSVLGSGLRGVPAALFDLAAVTGWCPKCFDGNRPAPAAAGLDTYLALLDEAYGASADVAASAGRRAAHRTLLGSAYLGAVVPDTAEANGSVAEALVENGQTAQAIGYLLRAVQLDPDDAAAQHELGSLLLERGEAAQAAGHFRAALRVRPDSAAAHNDLGVALADQGGLDEAIEHFKQAVNLEPGFEEARRNLASALRAHSKGEHR